MRRLSGLGLLAYGLFLVGALALGLWLREHGTTLDNGRVGIRDAAAKPNVVVVMTDDATRKELRAMPRTGRLIGDEGVSFERFYVSDPLSAPSRATLLTGQYAHNHGVTADTGTEALQAFDEEDTLATWLEDAGYRTALVGEYLSEPADDERAPPGWKEWHPGAVSEVDDFGHLAASAVRNADQADRPLFLFLGFDAARTPESLADVDRQTARLVETLQRHNELDDTYFFFTSDSGPSGRVPLLLRGPAGIPEGETSDALIGNVDLAPTIVDIAEAEATVKLDGRSLLPFAIDPERNDRGPLIVESLAEQGSPDGASPYTGLRTNRYLYLRHEGGREELFDLARDPRERESVAGDPAYGATKRALSAATAELADCEGDACTAPFEPPPPDR